MATALRTSYQGVVTVRLSQGWMAEMGGEIRAISPPISASLLQSLAGPGELLGAVLQIMEEADFKVSMGWLRWGVRLQKLLCSRAP